jgi:hypothetical protein
VLAVFLVPSLFLQSVLGRWIPFEPALERTLPALIGIVVIWPLAAPLFTRSSGSTFLIALLTPPLLIVGSVACASAVVPIAIERLLLVLGAESWATLVEMRPFSYEPPHEVFVRALSIAAIVVLALSILGAWRARNFVLGRQTHRNDRVRRTLQLFGVFAVAIVATVGATTALIWRSDPTVSRAITRVELLEKWRALSNQDLIVAGNHALYGSGPVAESESPVLEGLWQRSQPTHSDRWSSDLERLRDEREAIQFTLQERRERDGNALHIAANELFRRSHQKPVRNLAWALLGSRTRLSYAVQTLPGVTDEAERAHLVDRIADGIDSVWWNLSASEPTRREIPAAVVRENFVGSDASFEGSALRRARAAIVLEVLRRDLEAGTLDVADERRPFDRLEIDAQMLRRAREAVELPFPELARVAGVTERKASNVADLIDAETLHLRTSELFDQAKTDPSYLLPVR